MVAEIETPFGHALPPQSAHAITTHAAGWDVLQKFVNGEPETMAKIKSIYPRFGPFNLTAKLIGTIVSKLNTGQMCLAFPNRSSAEACKEFITSSDRKETVVDAKDVFVKAFDFHTRIYVTVFPAESVKTAIPFWQDPGTAISSRLAEDCLKHVDQLREVDIDSDAPQLPASPAFKILQSRIADLLERAPVSKHTKKVQPDDVYLFQTGMAAIYLPHTYLSDTRPGTTILYGFAFHSTPHVFERFGAHRENFKWFARGGDAEIDALNSFVQSERDAGRTIQALWAEFPTNPNLTTPNLQKLRKIADEYSFPVIIDETIASFANVDVLGAAGADAVMTSLTKSFSGYADVMAGSVALNPESKHYAEIKDTFSRHYTNDLYPGDAEVLEKNSQNYLERTAVLNRNAQSLANFFAESRFSHQVEMVYYPSTIPESKTNYDANLRTATNELPNPGYGCLLTIDFKTLDLAMAFYDNTPTHCGPHLGAHLTLVLPYPQLLIEMAKSDEFVVNKGGMSGKMIRISVGLEEETELLEAFEQAMAKIDKLDAQTGDTNPIKEATAIAAGTLT